MPIVPTPPIQGSPPPISSAFLRDFTGGINLAADDVQLPNNQFPDALDIDPDVKGGFARRLSFRSLGASGLSTSTSKPCRFLMQYPFETSSGYIIMGGTDGTHDRLAKWAAADILDGHARSGLLTFTTDSDTTLVYRWTGTLFSPAYAAVAAVKQDRSPRFRIESHHPAP